MSINKLPAAVWPLIYGAIYLGLQTFVSAQWPGTPPSYVLGIMALLGALQGTLKLIWPEPPAPDLLPGVKAQAAPRGLAAPAPQKESKLTRFLF